MTQRKVFLLLYNGSVQFPSFDVKVLWDTMARLSLAAHCELPQSYVTVTRHVNESGTFVHNPKQAHCWEIITRDLLYTRRRKRNGNTAPEIAVTDQPTP